ncbi:phosphate regulon sensor histidine kinase PhoR [Methylomonas methanica]|uniref:histidine kinase n=1 Tax=Methylomonas methanica (strain DSM 25384 / MC09) TaxID=857087 RepID=G0A262_METMM|nr:phosphate regulon sensor histidine kinase PhoR [Methylomonas methanica]AEG02605.1 histidine kinase [Methylomonas methanica MC09]
MDRWQREIKIVIALVLPALLLSYFIGHLSLMLLCISVLLLIKQTIAINELESWLSRGAFRDYRDRKGIWADIYYHLWKIKKTDKKRKKKLSRMIDQFRTSTNALPDAAVVLGEYAEIEWTNKAAREVLGLKRSDKGQRIPNLIRAPQFVQFLKSQDYQQKICITSPVNDSIILQISIVPYGAGLRLLLAQDVTQIKNMERMRTDFVANVSHELRTPLTVLKGYLETLLDMDDVPKGLARSFESMATQTERMQHLIDDLLMLAKLETKAKKFECVTMRDLLEQICHESDLLEKDERRIELTITTESNLKGDSQELQSAFTNLLVNALKYSPATSPVKVGWHQKTDGVLYLDVEDFGEGIASADIPRITERFYRAEVKRNHKVVGTGLGLAIVKHVLVRHDAKLEVESQQGKGSRFRCLFPALRAC